MALPHVPPKALARFRTWFEEFDARMWDWQFSQDAKPGKLNKLANQVIANFRAGRHNSH
jgi:hypothetical protein